MQRKNLSVSIVIPVYNEADQLGACLEAIAHQTATPHQVLVIDNNSTDDTVAVARRYSFVTVLTEPQQGVIYARTRGFDAVTADIIARIDADSIVPSNWVASIQRVFHDSSVDAVSGVAHYYNVALASAFNAIDLFFRRRLQRQLGNRVYLWGANMAMRRSAWEQVKPTLCNRAGLHEDYDIAIHMQQLGSRVIFDERLQAQVSSRRINVGYLNFLRYVLVSPNTYAQHGIRERWHMYEVVAVCAVGYLPARLLHIGYDASNNRFSLTKLLQNKPYVSPRVDPTVHVA